MAQAGEEAADQLEFDLLFSTRKPKDVRAGLSSGIKSVAKGVLAGRSVGGGWRSKRGGL